MEKDISERHVAQLLEAISGLLAVPELQCYEDLFDDTHEVIARADIVRRGIRDELAEMEGSI